MTLELVSAGFAIMLASLSGAFFAERQLSSFVRSNLRYLITFSLGVFVGVTFDLIREVLHESEGSAWQVAVFIIGGALIIELLSRLIPETHHHHGDHAGHAHSQIDARRMLAGDSLHNIGDGILLASAFLVSTGVGIATAIAIFIHEFVQEISEFFILKEAGYTTKKALSINFILSATIFIGVGLSLMLSSAESVRVPLTAAAAGGFIYIIFRDLFPHTLQSARSSKKYGRHIVVALVGLALMSAIKILVPHE